MTADIEHDLGAFVPRLVLELGAADVPSHTSVEGSMLSADISGFTALSERLAGKGKAGAEEITELINRCFTALIASADRFGGEVLKFGGDALLILFRGDGHGRRAVDAGLSMQAALRSSGAARRASLSMTVGVAEGPFDVFLVGSGYRELLVTGERAGEVIRLESEAASGETLVSRALAADLPPAMRVGERAGGVVVEGEPEIPDTTPTEPVKVGDLTLYVPATVIEQYDAFAELGGEHRLVSVGFLMVTGVGELLAESTSEVAAGVMHDLVDGVVAACEPYSVTPLHTDIAPDGVKFVLCAGAPLDRGNSSDAMLQAALQIAAIDSPLVLRVGVQTGRVFAGFLGSPRRRTYTLMGDPVNTAARMLGRAADRDVIAVEDAVDATRAVFDTVPLEPFTVKGKTDPIQAHRVVGVTDRVAGDRLRSDFVGRTEELARLEQLLATHENVAVLSGPAGVGKTRLLEEFRSRATQVRLFQAACSPYGSSSPYSLFRPLLRRGIGIDVDADPQRAGRLLSRVVTVLAPDLVPMLPLLAVPFGAEVAPTKEADEVDPEFRRGKIHDVVVDFFDATLAEPVVLIAEDVYWIDDASAELLTHLVRAAQERPWSAVLTRRPDGTWGLPEDIDGVVRFDLEPLTDDDIRTLAIQSCGRALADAELDLVLERSGGNPLYVIELAKAMEAGDAGALPDSIEELITSRIDALPPGARTALRVASVFGRRFDLDEVQHIAGHRVDAIALADLVAPSDGSVYQFQHSMYRDAAYEGLPFRQRKRLHGRVAEHLERHAIDPADVADVLSLHYSEAHNHDKAWQFGVIAGERAAAIGSTAAAATAFERALRSSRYADAASRHRRGEIARAWGDNLTASGHFEEAERAYRQARRALTDDRDDADMMRRLADLFERRGQLTRAIRWYRKAEAVGDSTPGGRRVRAAAVLGEAAVWTRRGEDTRCLELARRALDEAASEDDRSMVALALERIHLALAYVEPGDSERVGSSALAAYESLGDRAGVARTLINLGVAAYFVGDWPLAQEHYLGARDAALAAGAVVLAAIAAMNSAEILSDLGRWAQSVELLTEARRNFQAYGYDTGLAAAGLYLGVALTRLSRFDEAAAVLEDARRRLAQLDIPELLDDLETREVELALMTGAATAGHATTLLDLLGPSHPLHARGLRLAGEIAIVSAETERGVQLLQAALEADGGSYERLLVRRVLHEVDSEAMPDGGVSDGDLGSLGIDGLPPSPCLVGVRGDDRKGSDTLITSRT